MYERRAILYNREERRGEESYIRAIIETIEYLHDDAYERSANIEDIIPNM